MVWLLLRVHKVESTLRTAWPYLCTLSDRFSKNMPDILVQSFTPFWILTYIQIHAKGRLNKIFPLLLFFGYFHLIPLHDSLLAKVWKTAMQGTFFFYLQLPFTDYHGNIKSGTLHYSKGYVFLLIVRILRKDRCRLIKSRTYQSYIEVLTLVVIVG